MGEPGAPVTAGPKSLPTWWNTTFSTIAVMLPSVIPEPKMICAQSGEGLRDVGLRGDEHGQTDTRRDDHDVAVVVEVDPREGLEADDRDRREHRQRRAAQNGVRDARDDGTRLRHQPDEDHEHAGSGDDEPALHACQPHEPTFSAKQV